MQTDIHADLHYLHYIVLLCLYYVDYWKQTNKENNFMFILQSQSIPLKIPLVFKKLGFSYSIILFDILYWQRSKWKKHNEREFHKQL